MTTATTSGRAIVCAQGPDLIVRKANAPFRDLTGWDDPVGMRLSELLLDGLVLAAMRDTATTGRTHKVESWPEGLTPEPGRPPESSSMTLPWIHDGELCGAILTAG